MLGYVIPPHTTKPDEGVEEIQVEDKRYLVTVEQRLSEGEEGRGLLEHRRRRSISDVEEPGGDPNGFK